MTDDYLFFSRPLPDARLVILSLGAGVQSSTLALMAARGDLKPMPDFAIFADTGWEPRAVYDWLDQLEKQLPFPVIRTRREGDDLGEHAIKIATTDVTRTASPPYFTASPEGRLPKQCSSEFKQRPIVREVRRLLDERGGLGKAGEPVVEQWLGISTDEMQRLKDSDRGYIQHRWPLIEKRMNRTACLKWMADRQYPRPPKSSCIFCPYRGNEQWLDMRETAPEDWERAVAFDAAIRPGFYGMEGRAYVHRSRLPLDQVNLFRAEAQPDFFNEECDGICGV